MSDHRLNGAAPKEPARVRVTKKWLIVSEGTRQWLGLPVEQAGQALKLSPAYGYHSQIGMRQGTGGTGSIGINRFVSPLEGFAGAKDIHVIPSAIIALENLPDAELDHLSDLVANAETIRLNLEKALSVARAGIILPGMGR
jgi:hypothetical protein